MRPRIVAEYSSPTIAGFEFSDDQEISLTLKLLNRIEKDIDELRTKHQRAGFNSYVAIAGLAATLYVLQLELAKVTDLSIAKVGITALAGVLLLKIPWAIYQLIAIDQVKKKRHEPGRFFWSNDFFFELRLSGVFQVVVLCLSIVATFFLSIPPWVKATLRSPE